mmetsp:Transcript_3012/g.6957  ORF Transcript_3012/g.6957 Transcript_3012/m.6957 type:complete len:346 (+) Transcript_3012:152-1189(+)
MTADDSYGYERGGGVSGNQRFQDDALDDAGNAHASPGSTSHHNYRDGTAGNNGGSQHSSRKRSYQNRATGGDYGGRSAAGDAPPGTRMHEQRQMPLNAVYNSARAFIHEGPSAAVQELGSMGPIALTVLLIALVQYRHVVINSVRRSKHRLQDLWYSGGGPFAMLSDVYGYVRFAFLVAMDAVASLRLILPMYGGIDDDDSVGGLGMHGDDDEGAAAGRGRGGRRRRLYERNSESATIPNLEVTPLSGTNSATSKGSDSCSKSSEVTEKRRCRLCGLVHTKGGRRLVNGGYCHGIDPAFLDVNDYPSGWLVYDPIHGVSRKDVLDKKRAAAEQESAEEKKEVEAD